MNVSSSSKGNDSSMFGKEVTRICEEIDFYNNSSKVEGDSSSNFLDEDFSSSFSKQTPVEEESDIDHWFQDSSGSSQIKDPKEMERILDEVKAK